MIKRIDKEVLINAVVAGVMMSGAVLLKAALGDMINVNIDMNELADRATKEDLVCSVSTTMIQGE